MTSRRTTLRTATGTLLTLTCAVGWTAPAAHGGALAPVGKGAVVVSVDGPAELTMKVGRRTLPVRLFFVDAPRADECGGAEATAALTGFVRRAPGKFTYGLVERDKGSFARDASGRLIAQLAYRVRGRWRDLSDDLFRAGWARRGQTSTADATATAFAGYVSDGAPSAPGDDDLFSPKITQRGSWLQCGGRMHAPAGAPAPTTSASVWDVSEHGVTRAIGGLSLPANLTPDRALTMKRLAAMVPTEFTNWGYGCSAYVPSLQITAMAALLTSASNTLTCGDQLVGSIEATGPAPARLTRGGGVGSALASLTSAFPLLALPRAADEDDLFEAGPLLSGDGHRQWAWQTRVETDRKDRVAGFATFATPMRPGM